MSKKSLKRIEKEIFRKGSADIDEFAVRMHYEYCNRFGYIKFQDFLELPAGEFLNFLELMREEVKKMKNMRNGRRSMMGRKVI